MAFLYKSQAVGKVLESISWAKSCTLNKKNIGVYYIQLRYCNQVGNVQNMNTRGTNYSMWRILRECKRDCEAHLVRSIEQIW